MNTSNYEYNPNYQMNKNYEGYYNMNKDDRLIGGGFAFPFLLGGVTGAAIAPAFYNRPYYNNYRPYPGPYYPGPYYPPRPYFYR